MRAVFLIFVSIFIVCLASHVQSKTVYYDFHVRYTPGAPDGVFKEKMLTVNGVLPGTTIEAEVGDHVHVVVYNDVQDGQNITIHWHGIEQKGTPLEDGASHITQCPIKSGHSQTYFFQVHNAGTYWYHSHVKSQYTEGLWGPLIVRNSSERYKYAGEILMTLSDWYHRSAHENEYWYISMLSAGVSPYPDSALISGLGRYPCDYAAKRSFLQACSPEIQQRYMYRVKSNEAYRVRVINTAATSVFRFSIDDHKLAVIEVDGIEVLEPVEVDEVVLSSGERFSFLVSMNYGGGDRDRHLIRADLLTEYNFAFTRENVTPYTEALMSNVTAVLKYRGIDDGDLPAVTTEIYNYTQSEALRAIDREVVTLDPTSLKSADGSSPPDYYDKRFTLVANTVTDPHGALRSTFNGSWFTLPDYPILMSVIEGKPIPDGVMPHYIELGDVVDIVLNNAMPSAHPFHLHGHHFWILGTGKTGGGDYDPTKHELTLDGVKRDTVFVYGNSWGVIRFVADNPGVWNFHCHFDWHNLSGMAVTFIEAPEILQQNVTYTPEAIRLCKAHGIALPENYAPNGLSK